MPETLLYAAALPFEAARAVSILRDGHRSAQLHGHSFTAKVWAQLSAGWAPFPGGEVDELRTRLQRVLAPLDYAHLNRHLEQPTDENLARWIRERLDVPGVVKVGVLSTPHEGVDLDAADHSHVWRRYHLQSAHWLPNVPPGHKCGRLHGHGFAVILHADQDLGARAISVDYDHLDQLWAPLHQELDHACLNDFEGLQNPTSEMISAWLWQRLKPALPELSWVTVYETASCGAHFDGQRYRIWKETTLDSAVRLAGAPEGDHRRRVHGHTYTLRLHLNAPLDAVMGWTMDFGDVKAFFDPVFKRLDHQPLHELPGLHDADAASLARWIRGQVANDLPQIDRIDLYETPGCGAILSWGGDEPALPI
jgi:6-pyruvoyltetrahydropterin/6-carboxytetrahydropterin synthase